MSNSTRHIIVRAGSGRGGGVEPGIRSRPRSRRPPGARQASPRAGEPGMKLSTPGGEASMVTQRKRKDPRFDTGRTDLDFELLDFWFKVRSGAEQRLYAGVGDRGPGGGRSAISTGGNSSLGADRIGSENPRRCCTRFSGGPGNCRSRGRQASQIYAEQLPEKHRQFFGHPRSFVPFLPLSAGLGTSLLTIYLSCWS
jgi:hypothetical protein